MCACVADINVSVETRESIFTVKSHLKAQVCGASVLSIFVHVIVRTSTGRDSGTDAQACDWRGVCAVLCLTCGDGGGAVLDEPHAGYWRTPACQGQQCVSQGAEMLGCLLSSISTTIVVLFIFFCFSYIHLSVRIVLQSHA
jgi:hypothetical protein